MALPLVAIVGAPNVGKSTLFNRLTGVRRSIVTEEPGATRDRIFGVVTDSPEPFRLVDTGGLSQDIKDPLAQAISGQVEHALREADVVLFVVDARAGATAADRQIASMLRRRSSRVVLVANKLDVPSLEPLAADLYDLGLGDPVAVSSAHGSGIQPLLEAIEERLRPLAGPASGGTDGLLGHALRVALVGRPNVGKSSILNRILGEERALVSEIPGTTRDAVDSLLVRGNRSYLLVDTAGIRRRGRVDREAESLAVARAHEGIRRAHVAVLVVDGSQPLTAQDAHIAGFAKDASRPLMVAVNKWDLVAQREAGAKEWERTLRDRLRFVPGSPVLLVSARTGQRVERILRVAEELHAAGGNRVPTPALNRWLQDVATDERSAPAMGRSIRLLYAVQTGIHPPRFVLFCNDPGRVHFSLRRRLENSLRERFGFVGVPVDLRFRSRRRRSQS